MIRKHVCVRGSVNGARGVGLVAVVLPRKSQLRILEVVLSLYLALGPNLGLVEFLPIFLANHQTCNAWFIFIQ